MTFLLGVEIYCVCFGMFLTIFIVSVLAREQNRLRGYPSLDERVLPWYTRTFIAIRKYIGLDIPMVLIAVLVANSIFILKQVAAPWLLLPVVFFSLASSILYATIEREVKHWKVRQVSGGEVPHGLSSLHFHQGIAATLFLVGGGVITLLIVPTMTRVLPVVKLLGDEAGPGEVIVFIGAFYWLVAYVIQLFQKDKS